MDVARSVIMEHLPLGHRILQLERAQGTQLRWAFVWGAIAVQFAFDIMAVLHGHG